MKRPPNADPNTAFTVVSEPDEAGDCIVRVSLHPEVLDCEPEGKGPKVDKPIVWTWSDAHLDASCRSPGGYRILDTNTAIGLYLEGKLPWQK